MRMKTKKENIEQYKKSEEFFTYEMDNLVLRFRPKITSSKDILKSGTFEDRITLLWVLLESDPYFVEDAEEWGKMAKAIEKENGAPVLEWCALYSSTLDWLYSANIFIKTAKKNLYKIVVYEKEFRQKDKKLNELTKPLDNYMVTIGEMLKNKGFTQEEITKFREIEKRVKAITKEYQKESKAVDIIIKNYPILVEDTIKIIGGIKSSGLAFTEYYERLGFANFMPSALTEMIEDLSSSNFSYLAKVSPEYNDALDFIKIFYDKLKPNRRLTNKTTKSIKENINYYLNECR